MLDRLLRTADARLRLGWRLSLWLALTVVVALVTAALLPAGTLTSSVALLVGAVVGGVLVLALDGREPAALGFPLAPEAAAEFLRGLALGTGVALAVVALMAAVGALRWISEDGSLVGWVSAGVGALAFLALPAAAEEALLRGYPLQALTEAWGPSWAIALTAGLFAAAHLWNPGMTTIGALNIGVAGVFLGVVYLRTASLWCATAAHLGWNWAHGYVADVPVSGLELLDAPFYDGVARGPTWLGGGSFGPEGSLLATVVVAAAALLCWRSRWVTAGPSARASRPLVLAVVAVPRGRGAEEAGW